MNLSIKLYAAIKQYQKLGIWITDSYESRLHKIITFNSNVEHVTLSILWLYRDENTIICKITHSNSFAVIQRAQSISFRIPVKCLQSMNALLHIHYLFKYRHYEIFQYHLNIFHLASEPLTKEDRIIL
jgi:hypothetical protein